MSNNIKKPNIAIITDFGLEDPFVGVMKGVIFSINPNVNIIDILHDVSPQDVLQGAFILSNTYKYFPPGTIFLAVVDPGVGTRRKAIIVKAGPYYFIGPDNGLLTLALQKFDDVKIYEINNTEYQLNPISYTFHGRDVFAPAAAYFSKGTSIDSFGPSIGQDINNIVKLKIPKIKFESNFIKAPILFADRFGNLVTSLSSAAIKNIDIINIKLGPWKIFKINKSYSESPPGKPLAIIGSYETLEIAINGGSALDKLGRKFNPIVEIFYG